MIEPLAKQFVGKTVESIKAIPFDVAKTVPFLLVVKFTDGSQLRMISDNVEGNWTDEESRPRVYQFSPWL